MRPLVDAIPWGGSWDEDAGCEIELEASLQHLLMDDWGDPWTLNPKPRRLCIQIAHVLKSADLLPPRTKLQRRGTEVTPEL